MVSSLKSQLLRHNDGSTRLAVSGERGNYHISIYADYSAVISKAAHGIHQEVSVSGAREAAALMTTIITLENNAVEKRVLTNFQGKATREDVFTATPAGISRHTKWAYPNGTRAVAKYSPGRRDLEVTKPGAAIQIFETTGRLQKGILQAETKNASGSSLPVKISGTATVSPLKSNTVTSYDPSASTPTKVSVTTVPSPGGNTKTTVTVSQPNSIQSEWVVTNSDHVPIDHGRDMSASGTVPGGGISVEGGSKGFVDGNPSHYQITHCKASTDGQGGITSEALVEDVVTNPDETTSTTLQISSWTTNADGSSSRTNTTVSPDGTQEVTTITTDKDGHPTTETHNFDEYGNETRSNGNPPETSGEDPPEKSGTAYPNPDGTDEGPTPQNQGAADKVVSAFLGSANAYLGGNPMSSAGVEGGDPPPFAAIAAAVTNPGVNDSESGVSLASGVAATVGLRGNDPNLNPNALVANVARLTAMSSLNSGLLAANKAASFFS